MVDPFDILAEEERNNARYPQGDPFDMLAKEEGVPEEPWYKSLARTAYQIPSGLAQAVTYPMDIFNILATGGALDEEGIQELERAAERSGIPFDRNEYINAVMQQSQNIPTQSNVERMVEESTGLPLTAQTPLQKGVKFASSGAGFTPGTLSQKVVGGAVSEGLKEGLEYVGVPEPLAELASLPGGVALGSKAPAITASKITKPSGLTTRKFEEVKSPSKVSESKISKINEKVESEFKGIADKIFEESPIYDVQSALKEGPLYKESVVEEFKKVQSLADELSESISSKDITKRLSENVSPKRQKGFMDSESDKAYKKVIQDLIKETPAEDVPISPGKLVEQYRKNNEELGKLFEPGQSKAYNSGKSEAYLDYNKAIAETIEGVYPNSEFSKLFKDSNKKWSQIKDAEAISEYMDKLFESGKINFKEAQKAFESKRLSHSLERALGKKGHAEFKQLVNDLSSIKDPLSNLRGLPEKSFEDYAKSMFPFILSKTYGTAKFAFNTLTGAKKQLWEFMLDKPKYRLEWKKGVEALKANDPIKAKRIFDDLKEDVNQVDPEVLPKLDSYESYQDFHAGKNPGKGKSTNSQIIDITPKTVKTKQSHKKETAPTPKEKSVKKYNERKKSPITTEKQSDSDYLEFLNEKGDEFKKSKKKELTKSVKELKKEIQETKDGKYPYYDVDHLQDILKHRERSLNTIEQSLSTQAQGKASTTRHRMYKEYDEAMTKARLGDKKAAVEAEEWAKDHVQMLKENWDVVKDHPEVDKSETLKYIQEAEKMIKDAQALNAEISTPKRRSTSHKKPKETEIDLVKKQIEKKKEQLSKRIGNTKQEIEYRNSLKRDYQELKDTLKELEDELAEKESLKKDIAELRKKAKKPNP